MPCRETVLLAAITALTLAAGAVLAGPSSAQRRLEQNERLFQQAVGGLGFGPAVEPSGCAFCFDPRLCPRCPWEWGPVAGGAWLCPHHGLSVLRYRQLPEAGFGRDSHAGVP